MQSGDRSKAQFTRISYLILMAIIWAVPVASSETQLVFGIGDYPPYEFADGETLKGFDLEVVKAVVQNMGYRVKFELRPWNRVYAKGVSGYYTGLFSMVENETRKSHFYFTRPISSRQSRLVKRKEDDIQWQTYTDLTKYRIGYSAAYAYPKPFLDAIKKNILTNIVEIAGNDPELKQLDRLVRKRTDLFICNFTVCSYLIKTHSPRFDQLDFAERPIEKNESFHVGFSKQWPDALKLVKEFNHHFNLFIKSGKREEILKKYGVENMLELDSE